MEAYQPLNTYSFCKTVNKTNLSENKTRNTYRQINRTSDVVNRRHHILYKTFLSIIVVLVVAVATVFVKIEAREPISQTVAAGEVKIVVGSGDSLWKLASAHYPQVSDTGFAIYLIKERNGLNNNQIHPGQSIILPHIK